MNKNLAELYERHEQMSKNQPHRKDYDNYDEYDLAVEQWLFEFRKLYSEIQVAERER